LPQGPQAIVGKELSDTYFSKVGSVVVEQVARAGLRIAAWLNGIADEHEARKKSGVAGEL